MTYQEIAKVYSLNPRDVHTVPTTGKEPVWFYVSTDRGTMFVESARTRTPSSRIAGRRMLNENEFEAILSVYQKRKRGISVSREASDITQNQVYWYGIFAEMNL